MDEHTSRRRFLTSAVASAGALAASRLWPPADAFRRLLVGEPSSSGTGSVVPTPLRMLAVGDSVMWGQGLLDSQKYAFKTAEFIRQRIGRDVILDFYAHSGARIDTGESSRETYHGEIGIDRPSILTQLDIAMGRYAIARVDASEVGLVLLNGGANDFGFKSITDPTIDAAWIRRRVQQTCGSRMRDALLPTAMRLFPNAIIVVTGYYQPFSEQSTGIGPAFTAMGFALPRGDVRSNLAVLEKSKAFYLQSSEELRNAVNVHQAASGNRLLFVDPMFMTENAWGAPQSFIWEVPNADPVSEARIRACNDLAAQLNIKSLGMSIDPTCRVANIFHPNIAGAQRYADRVTTAITPFLSRWTLRQLTVAVSGTPTSDGSQAVTVSVRDAATGQPVDAQVELGANGTMAANTPVKKAFCKLNPQSGPNLGEPLCSRTAIVKAQGYESQSVSFNVRMVTVDDEVLVGGGKVRANTKPLRDPRP